MGRPVGAPGGKCVGLSESSEWSITRQVNPYLANTAFFSHWRASCFIPLKGFLNSLSVVLEVVTGCKAKLKKARGRKSRMFNTNEAISNI